MDHLEINAKLTKTDDDITADLMDAIREADDILFPDSESEEESNGNPQGKPGPSVTDRADSPQEQAMDSDRPDSPIHPYFLAHPEDSPYSGTFWSDEAATRRQEAARQAATAPAIPATPLPVHLPVNRDLCWHCGQIGHTRNVCQQRRPLLFCSRCGLRDVLSDCSCPNPTAEGKTPTDHGTPQPLVTDATVPTWLGM
ncbi:hypothetical protein JTB14_022650 [Gonioctena quinquepunctata]|nr:hypothetical protein JTB14_022650 [Gonioctena quinquepunctata]